MLVLLPVLSTACGHCPQRQPSKSTKGRHKVLDACTKSRGRSNALVDSSTDSSQYEEYHQGVRFKKTGLAAVPPPRRTRSLQQRGVLARLALVHAQFALVNPKASLGAEEERDEEEAPLSSWPVQERTRTVVQALSTVLLAQGTKTGSCSQSSVRATTHGVACAHHQRAREGAADDRTTGCDQEGGTRRQRQGGKGRAEERRLREDREGTGSRDACEEREPRGRRRRGHFLPSRVWVSQITEGGDSLNACGRRASLLVCR